MSRARIVRFMLEEVGADYETVVLGYGAEMKTPEYLKLNPMGKVPTIRHGEVVVTEAAAICAYLADAFPAAGLAPKPGTPARGPYYRWLFFGAGPVEQAVTDAAREIGTGDMQEQGRLGYGSLDRVLDTLEALLEGREWLLGGRFSAVDVYLGSQIAWGLMFGTMEARPGFDAYVERLTARPAARAAAKLDDALMPQESGHSDGQRD